MSNRNLRVLTTLRDRVYAEYERLTAIVSQPLELDDDKIKQQHDASQRIAGIELVMEQITEFMTEISANEQGDYSAKYATMTIPELAAELKRLKGELDVMGAEKTEIQKQYDYLSISVLPDRMDEEGIESVKIAGVGRLQTSSDIQCNIPSENRESVQNWLRENGHAAMITESVNASTFKAWVKEQMKNENEYPKDLIKVHPYSRATVVKV